MKVGIYTLGCKVNTYESEYIKNLFTKKGYIISDYEDICDIYIINTCTVTNNSDNKSMKIIRQAIKRNKDACIVAMGCFIEANKNLSIEGVNILIGNKDKSKIVEYVEEYLKTKENIIKLYSNLDNEFENMEINAFESHARAFIKVQDGCENFCTYCIIPYVRGKCRSKPFDLVIKEAKELVLSGHKELVLTGIHTGNYGRDLDKEINLYSLLKELVKIDNLKLIRISSIEITELTDEIIELIKNEKIIADHLHIPLQAGTDEILKLMNRKYDTNYYKEKISLIRKIRPNISITTDVIVGFPGETDELFDQTYNFCKEIKFSKIHVFPYSVRTGTPAAKFKNQVPNNIKKNRAKKLIELSEILEKEYLTSFIDKKLEVLIETSNTDFSTGHTSNFIQVKINEQIKRKELIEIEIVKEEYPYAIAKRV
ncbi:MAG: tRNA (N(6)-L-threonylcarbamoyladenosine(37)-C(2))-methylthiotransferase MtaB [Bacilli bacterium]|nr:tRNA (N(6)-L-threonylcarbamoyladenosine(37)-C(2))-methylthiotransferase MtaB [Bacilli bacterium]